MCTEVRLVKQFLERNIRLIEHRLEYALTVLRGLLFLVSISLTVLHYFAPFFRFLLGRPTSPSISGAMCFRALSIFSLALSSSLGHRKSSMVSLFDATRRILTLVLPPTWGSNSSTPLMA